MHFSNLASIIIYFATIALTLPAEEEAEAYVPYAGPGNYYIQNAASGTVLDLLYGNPGPNTQLNG
jgi:hypothetical protein